jgi:hypothetical protein
MLLDCAGTCAKKKLRRHRRTCVCGLLIDCAGTASLPSVYCNISLDCAGTCVRKKPSEALASLYMLFIDWLRRYRLPLVGIWVVASTNTTVWRWNSHSSKNPKLIWNFRDSNNAFVLVKKRCPTPQKLICQSPPVSGNQICQTEKKLHSYWTSSEFFEKWEFLIKLLSLWKREPKRRIGGLQLSKQTNKII